MKKIHRFLIKEKPINSTIEIEDKELLHLMKNVLKLLPNEECIVFYNNSDDYLCKIKNIDKKSINLEVVSVVDKKNIDKNIIACISITKRDSFEMIVQKLTEIGVSEIKPIVSSRTIKQGLRLDRLQKISDEALEQSGGSKCVKIHEPSSLDPVLQSNKGFSQYCLDMGGEKSATSNEKNIAFYIGPEGGWSDEDKRSFEKHNVQSYTLGNTTLRAETAAIIAGYKLLWN